MLPAIGILTYSRSPASLTKVSKGSKKSSLSLAPLTSFETESWTSGEFTSGWSTTTRAGWVRPEVKFSSRISKARFPSTAFG